MDGTQTIATAAAQQVADAATGAAMNALTLAESTAEEKVLQQVFGTARGAAFFRVLTGNATVQQAVTSQNLKAASFLERLFLQLLEGSEGKMLLAALEGVGLA